MHQRARLSLFALLALLSTAFGQNVFNNGGFEAGEAGWMWEQWAKKPLPGYINRDDMAEGLAAFTMTLPDGTGERWMAIESEIQPTGDDYLLSFALKPLALPAESARVRFQRAGKSWWHGPDGKPDLVQLGGTSDEWLTYRFRIPAAELEGVAKVRVFIYHGHISQGELGIDAVRLRPAKAGEATVLPDEPEGSAAVHAEAGEPELLANGGFEQALQGWMYEQWNGKAAPGTVVTDEAPEGRAWFRYGGATGTVGGYMARELQFPDEQEDYVVRFRVKAEGLPENAGRVRLQIPGQGWLHTEGGYADQVRTGGTTEWTSHSIELPAGERGSKGKATLFFYNDAPGQGSLGIDAVELLPASAAVAAGDDQASFAPVEGRLRGVTFQVDVPSVLLPVNDATVAVRVTPERAIYRTGKLPAVRVAWVEAAGAELRWEVRDGFGEVLDEGTVAAAQAGEHAVGLAPGHGYYEVIARLHRDGQVLGEARRSIGALERPAPTDTDEPFGLWIQGRDLYPELGVRWVREGLYYGSMQADPEGFLGYWRKQFTWYRSHQIQVLAYPKAQPAQYRISRELMEDTPAAWAALEAHWRQIVMGLRGHVDAWGVLNEPMADFWEGTDEMVVRYWALMHRIVDELDPETPVVGPSINPLKPRHIQQWGDLLELGIGPFLDGIEVHTYTPSPEDNNLLEATERFQAMAKAATQRDLAVWVTEMGLSATYPGELNQAEFVMRSWLLAKEAEYPMMIWHMFSWPQGESQREVNFGNWRNDKEQKLAPQPRPAGLTFGVMTRLLAGTTFRNKLDYLGPSVHAYVLETRDGEAMLALWTTSAREYEVRVPVDRASVRQVGIFGREQTLRAEDGLVGLSVDRSPVFLSPMPAYMLDAEPVARVAETVKSFPGGEGLSQLRIRNPLQTAASVRIEWMPRDGWALGSRESRWELAPQAAATTELRVTVPVESTLGAHQLYGKLFLDGTYTAPVAVPVQVDPPVKIVDIRPALGDGAQVVVQLELVNAAAEEVQIRVSGEDTPRSVDVGEAGTERLLEVRLPVRAPPSGELRSYTVSVTANGVTTSEEAALSFVPTRYFAAAPTIDGRLDEWGELTRVQPAGVAEPMAIGWGWDEHHLYLAAAVTDAFHHQEEAPFATWQHDSLQVGLVPARVEALVRPPNTGLQEAEYVELDIALRGDEALIYRHRTVNKHLAPNGAVAAGDIRRAVQHSDGVTRYEVAIPIGQLGALPLSAGQVLRGAILLNDADAEGGGIERQTRAWFEGIKLSKDPATFGHLILER